MRCPVKSNASKRVSGTNRAEIVFSCGWFWGVPVLAVTYSPYPLKTPSSKLPLYLHAPVQIRAVERGWRVLVFFVATGGRREGGWLSCGKG
eukprot:3088692-Rhodomonas_salina.2